MSEFTCIRCKSQYVSSIFGNTGFCGLCYPVETNDLPKSDPINHPPHYNAGKIEPIDVIEDWRLGFCLGNTIKYIARCEHKGTRVDDLKKAAWYLQREIASAENVTAS